MTIATMNSLYIKLMLVMFIELSMITKTLHNTGLAGLLELYTLVYIVDGFHLHSN
jgi:uncharacterized membrane protein YhaH (DUF805 family)